ncbi:MAG: dTDP-4-dehydrorhamnose reductase [Halothiobacillaceae bacterium]|nr:dTDP-4-dehydrorhamnose reductase [Halothiobacillaceae bacterium]
MNILVTGADGQVGWELRRCLMPLGQVTAVDKRECDLGDPQALRLLLERTRPDVIVNAAAYTAVDKAEAEESLAMAINGDVPGVLAEAAKKYDALLVHYSTDYVFDGRKQGAYTETDTPCPVNAYGRTKLAGERAILDSGCDHLILRTTWVYASRGHNFVKTILRLAETRTEFGVVDDQKGAPTWARNIADWTAHIVRQAQAERLHKRFVSGIYNLAAAGTTSWCGFAASIMELARQRGLLSAEKIPVLNPIPTESYPLPAERPLNSCLDMSGVKEKFGLFIPGWDDALARCMDELADRLPPAG